MNKGIADMDGTAEQHGQDALEALSRRARVRRCLIDPLQADGLVRPKGVTVEAHQTFLDKLADRLGYLDDALLSTLAEMVLSWAEGPQRNLWPAFATIWNAAIRLRPPPDDERHIMTTWLVSRAGPMAREAGHLVELHQWLRKCGMPPGDHAMKTIREEAAENARTRARLARAVEEGRATASEREWLSGYLRALAYCEALVADGEARRAALAASTPVNEGHAA